MTSTTNNTEPRLSYEAIAAIAETIAKSTGIRTIQNFEPIIVGMGGRVERINAKQWASIQAPSITVHGPRSFTVHLSQDNPSLDRLLMACALGHYILHSSEGKSPQSFLRFAMDARSVEALWFGMAIIISDEAFAIAEAHGGIEDHTVANLFQTSPELIALKKKLRLAARKAQERAAQPIT